MTHDREGIKKELQKMVTLGSCAFVAGCHENEELADYIITREQSIMAENEFNTTSLRQDYQNKIEILEAKISEARKVLEEERNHTDRPKAIDNAIEVLK